MSLYYWFEGNLFEYEISREKAISAVADILTGEDSTLNFEEAKKAIAILFKYDYADDFRETFEEELEDYFKEEARYDYEHYGD